MKTRNDKVLYSGVGAGTTSVKQRQLERAVAKQEKRRVLEPSAELFFSIIQAERDSIPKQIMQFVTPDTTNEALNSEVRAFAKYDAKLQSLQLMITNTMRTKEVESDDE